MKQPLRVLKDLYLIHSPSFKEEPMLDYIKEILNQRRIPFKQDKKGNVYRILKNKPIISCHTDQVQKTGADDIVLHKGKIYGFEKDRQCGLGADDKNGIYVVLSLLMNNDVGFIFSVQEERGGGIDELLDRFKKLDSIPYALVFDRKGNSDIIATKNHYCCKDLLDDVEAIAAPWKYKEAQGTFSDANALSRYMPCVNLSVGYYNAHSSAEYTVLEELLNAIDLGNDLLLNLKGPYDKPETKVFSPLKSRVIHTSRYWNDDYWDDHPFVVSGRNTQICNACSKPLPHYSNTCSYCGAIYPSAIRKYEPCKCGRPTYGFRKTCWQCTPVGGYNMTKEKQ